ncbi:MAG: HesA/MoeB/ThiF family protein, partial [Candidatus Bathyarchaeota archaeon]|nr:HesA/MoeB/ThiF family protein [Candidatus Bathyarchaeota archaeon]
LRLKNAKKSSKNYWRCKRILTEAQKKRYSRQIISPYIGEEGQEKLSRIRVLQIGAGGLGSPFALYLVAAGIKELTIIDNDKVSISNLQRQILYSESQIGMEKVLAAKERLTTLNSEVEIKLHKEYIDENSIEKHIKNKDFIVDCSDNFRTKFLVNRVAVENGVKAVIAGIKDFFGQIITINPKVSACYECVFNQPNTLDTSESPLPVIGVTPGILGTLEALEVIKTALNLPNLENKLLMVNLLNFSFDTIDLIRNESCFCSK